MTNKLVKRLKQLTKLQRWLIISGAGLIAVMAVQLSLPSDRILPRTRLDGNNIGWQSKQELSNQINRSAANLKLDLNGQFKEVPAEATGITIYASDTTSKLPTLGWGDKLIPLWPFIKLALPADLQTSSSKDQQKIEQFAGQIAKDLYRPPVDAKAEFKDGQLSIVPESEGWEYKPEIVAEILLSENLSAVKPISISGQSVPANVAESDLAPLKDQFQKITSQKLAVTYNDKIVEIDRNLLTSWLIAQQTEGSWQIVISGDLLNPEFIKWSEEYNTPAGTTQVHMIDDVETTRTTGESGHELDKDAIINQFNAWLLKPATEPLQLATKEVSPKVNITRTYSSASAELQSKINAWVASHSGHYQIAVSELGGQGREASYNLTESTVMASTYKTFLAFVAYRLSESGGLNLGTTLANGKSIGHCIEDMIVVSDNPCAIEIGKYIGWGKVDYIISAAGFSGVKLNNYDASGNIQGDKLVNAQQQARFLAQLSSGSLINSGNTNALLSYMKRQVYRDGIPAGSRGAAVANKVGFLGSYLHDVGIVYGPKSTYALVIMSESSSWGSIRDLSQAIYDFMN